MGKEVVKEIPVRIPNPKQFQKEHAVFKVVDCYKELLREVHQIRNPKTKFAPPSESEIISFITNHAQGKNLNESGEWFYFPWNQYLVHYLPDELHQELRTAMNRNIITADEQKKYYDAVIAVVGLSVGS